MTRQDGETLAEWEKKNIFGKKKTRNSPDMTGSANHVDLIVTARWVVPIEPFGKRPSIRNRDLQHRRLTCR